MDFAVLPPEINSARTYAAAGAGAAMSPVDIEVNRALMSALLSTNVFGQNTSLIATRPRADPLHATRGLAADVIESWSEDSRMSSDIGEQHAIRNGEPH